MRLNYAYAQYNDPSGLNASIGRINETDGSLGLLWADQWNGATAGYNKYGLNARVSYGFTWPIYDSTVNNNPLSQPTPGSSCAAAARRGPDRWRSVVRVVRGGGGHRLTGWSVAAHRCWTA